jgi:hypothetical protein
LHALTKAEKPAEENRFGSPLKKQEPTSEVMTSALAPALSPSRGRIIRRVLSHVTFRIIVRLKAKDKESVIAMRS